MAVLRLRGFGQRAMKGSCRARLATDKPGIPQVSHTLGEELGMGRHILMTRPCIPLTFLATIQGYRATGAFPKLLWSTDGLRATRVTLRGVQHVRHIYWGDLPRVLRSIAARYISLHVRRKPSVHILTSLRVCEFAMRKRFKTKRSSPLSWHYVCRYLVSAPHDGICTARILPISRPST